MCVYTHICVPYDSVGLQVSIDQFNYQFNQTILEIVDITLWAYYWCL